MEKHVVGSIFMSISSLQVNEHVTMLSCLNALTSHEMLYLKSVSNIWGHKLPSHFVLGLRKCTYILNI